MTFIRAAALVGVRASSKIEALTVLAREAAGRCGLDAPVILDALMARERLGTTGLGSGIAIPHARFASLQQFHMVFARLRRPIDFAAFDALPVDLVFLLLSPEAAGGKHLTALSRLSRILHDRDLCRDLRSTDDIARLEGVLSLRLTQKAA